MPLRTAARLASPRRTLSAPVAAASLALALILVGLLFIRDLRQLASDAHRLNEELGAGLRFINALQVETEEARRSLLYALSTTDANEQLEFVSRSREAGERAARMLRDDGIPGLDALRAGAWSGLADSWDRYLAIRDETVGLILEGSIRESVALDLGQGTASFAALQRELRALGDAFANDASLRVASVDQRTATVLARAGFVWASGLLALATAALLWSRRQQLEARVHEETSRNEMLESVLEAVVVADAQGRIIGVNPAAADLFGVPRDGVSGLPIQTFLDAPVGGAASAQALAEASERAGGGLMELAGRRGDGSAVALEARVVRRSVAGTTTFTAHLRDITERQRASAELRAARDAAETASKAKGVFLATMSHEVRTPLNVMLGMTDLLLGSALHPEQRAWVEAGRTSSETLVAHINGILDYSRLEAERLELDIESCNLPELVDSVMLQASVARKDQPLVLSWTIDAGTPRVVLTDPLRLRQILLNLLSNAVKFTAQGEVAVRVTSREEGTARYQLFFAVRDTGTGIPEADLPTLFEPFSQADAARVHGRRGAGLGLSISRRLAERLGGGLEVRSTPGDGSVFTLRIVADAPSRASVLTSPIARTLAPAAAGAALPDAPEDEPHGLPASGPGQASLADHRLAALRVLLVEDDPGAAVIVDGMLRQFGCEPAVAHDGPDAVHAATRQAFEVVLMDLDLPRLDGVEAARQLRAMLGPACPPIVPLTGSVSADSRRRCAEAGMAGFLAKPVSAEALRQTLCDVVRADRSPRS